MVWWAIAWVLLAAAVVYGVATLVAAVKVVPHGKVGIVTRGGGARTVLGEGRHIINPFGASYRLVRRGPVMLQGGVRDVLTRDGWTLGADFQLNAELVDETLATVTDMDWGDATRQAAATVLRNELANNDVTDIRPRSQALEEGVRDEVNLLAARFGSHVDWLRVNVRWPEAMPPVREPPASALGG